MKRIFILAAAATIGLSACNKTNSFSNRLSGENWQVTKLTVDGNEEDADHLPELHFDDCDIYDEVCMGEWYIEDEHAEFAWQFNDNGESLTISNQSEAEHDHDDDHGDDDHGDDHNHDHGEEEEHVEPVDQCQELSGTYTVEEMTRSAMKISSNAVIGHDGETVTIEFERGD